MSISKLYATRTGKTLLILAVLLSWLFARHHLSQMDERFFQPSLWGAKGLVLYFVGDYSGAAEAYRGHLQYVYSQGRTTGDEGLDAIVQRDYRAAKELSEHAITKDPANVRALLNLAEIALEEHLPEQALPFAEKILITERDQYDALLLSATAYARMGKYNKAVDALSRAIRHGRTESWITSFLMALHTTGELTALPSSQRPLCLLAEYHRYLRIFDDSHADITMDYADAAIRSGDRPDEATFIQGVIFEKQRRQDDALERFLKAIEINPKHAESYRRASWIYSDRGDLLNEFTMQTRAVESAPDDPFYAISLAVGLRDKLGDYHQALRVMLTLLDAAPQDPDAMIQVAYLYHLVGEEERAIVIYRVLLQRQPNNAEYHQRLAESLAELRRDDEAIAMLREAVTLDPRNSAAHIGLAEIYMDRRRAAEAVTEYELAGSLDINSHTNLCTMYQFTFRFQQAANCFRRLLAVDPQNAQARQLLPYVLMNLREKPAS
jgi:tetratricopeptide (TPR) repeat protein